MVDTTSIGGLSNEISLAGLLYFTIFWGRMLNAEAL